MFLRATAVVAVATALAPLNLRAAPPPLSVCLVTAPDAASGDAAASLAACQRTLEADLGAKVTVIAGSASAAMPSLSTLRTCDAALFYACNGELGAENARLLRAFLDAGKGLVVVRPGEKPWRSWAEFAPQVLGAKLDGKFANGYPMHVINLFPHAIFTGVTRLETRQQMPQYVELAGDAQMIMEGTVGEATAPLAWLRQLGPSRICCVLPGDADLFRDPDFERLLRNALLWTTRHPIPGARALVQRSYLADAYPGALSVTLPGGPVLCWDPVRGGMSQVWDGDFVDLRPRWITKQGQPARIGGEEFFRDAGRGPFWLGSGADEVPFQFKGYSVAGEFPELYYEVGDRAIREELRPLPSGMGVSRRFHVGPGTTPLWYRVDPQAAAEVVATGLQREDRGFAFASKGAGEFTIEVRQRKINAP